MTSISLNSSLLQNLVAKTVVITGGANGIGGCTVRHCHLHGANVVIADLPSAHLEAENLIASLSDHSRALFVPVNIAVWAEMQALFSTAVGRYGSVDIVIANAGVMESRDFFDFEIDDEGQLIEDLSVGKVIDVNLKGAMNTLRLAAFSMKENSPAEDGWRGSIVLVSSTSGYFGGTEVVSYVSSKHGIIGLLRSSCAKTKRMGIRLNGVAPFITPTYITSGYSDLWNDRGLPINTPDQVALGILQMSLDPDMQGRCSLIAGGVIKELESRRADMLPDWMGKDTAETFRKAEKFFRGVGGYPLPQERGSKVRGT